MEESEKLENEPYSSRSNARRRRKYDIMNRHIDFKEKREEDEQEDEDDGKRNMTKRYKCDVCNRSYNTRLKRDAHKKSHQTPVDVPDNSSEPGSEVRFICRDCPQVQYFTTKSKYLYHLGSKHPGNVQFVCEICACVFRLKANYKAHLATHNITVKKEYTCAVCKGTFVNKSGYESHLKRFPGPHIKQSCSHCGFSFSKEQHMRNHRCKILLFEAAKAENERRKSSENADLSDKEKPEDITNDVENNVQELVAEVIELNHVPHMEISAGQVLHLEGTSGSETGHQIYQIVPDWSVVSNYIIREK